MSFWIWLKYEIIKFKYRYDRGRMWLNYLTPLLVAFGIVYYKAVLASGLLIPLGVGYIILSYCIGWYDEIHGIWKADVEYGSHQLNPFNQAVMKKLEAIERNVK